MVNINVELNDDISHIKNKLRKSFKDYNGDYSELFNLFTQYILDLTLIYDLVILTTRRCFDLVCCVYNNNFSSADEKYIDAWEKIVSSQSIIINKDKITGKKVLLVDDIMIHGKAVYSLYSKLKDYDADKVDTFVLARNIEIPDFYKIVSGDYECLYRLSQDKWLDLSNKIVEYFVKNNQTYVSYVYPIKGNSEELVNTVLELKEIAYDESFNVFNNLSGFSTEKTKIKYFDVHSNLTKSNIFFRQYTFPDETTYTVPYCILNTFESEILKNSWENLLNKYNINEKLKELITDSIDIYKCYTLILCMYLFNNSKNLNYSREIEKSFYEGFYNDITELIEQIKESGCNTFEKLDLLLKETDLNPSEEVEFELLNHYEFNGEFKSNDDFREYISSITEKEDEVFKNNLDMYYDSKEKLIQSYKANSEYIPVSVILDKTKCVDMNSFIAFKILLSDAGAVSFNIVKKIIDDVEYVTTVIKTGEQSYRLNHADNPEAYVIANKFYDIYKSLYGQKTLNSNEIDKYIEYLTVKKKNSAEGFINQVKNILSKITQEDKYSVLNKYKVLMKTVLQDKIKEYSDLTYDYFLN